MQEWLESVAGPAYATALMWTLLALVGLFVLLLLIRVVRSLTGGTFVAGGRNRKARLAVMDAAAVDSQRRLVLVRRDDVEHLILIGGPTDVVVEQNIRLVAPSRRPGLEDARHEPQPPLATPVPPAAPSPPPSATVPPKAPPQPMKSPVQTPPLSAPVQAQPAAAPVQPQPAAPPVQPQPAAPQTAAPQTAAQPLVPRRIEVVAHRPQPSVAPANQPPPPQPRAAPAAPVVTAPSVAAPRPAQPVSPAASQGARVPMAAQPVAMRPAAPIVAGAVPARPPAQPQTAMQAQPPPPQDDISQEFDEAMLSELQAQLDAGDRAAQQRSADDEALDAEMSRLLGELSGERR